MSKQSSEAININLESDLVLSMAIMDVNVNRAQASGNAFLFLALTTVLGAGLVFLFVSGRFANEGAFIWLLFFIFVAWIFTFLIAWTLRLMRLRKFEGPLLRITDRGLVDFWATPDRMLLWDEIEYTEWKNPNLAPVLVFVPKAKSTAYLLRRLIGIPSYQYRSNYLDAPNDAIAKFVMENAPDEILR